MSGSMTFEVGKWVPAFAALIINDAEAAAERVECRIKIDAEGSVSLDRCVDCGPSTANGYAWIAFYSSAANGAEFLRQMIDGPALSKGGSVRIEPRDGPPQAQG